ncbi:glycosyltransferase family 2 protein [Litoribacter ruber]|uniref:Glycosyltransferase family 2 protein n=1 Tax=Litoribacter ruber TaxID=702568 RepID=A0AAP2CES8_9BACT|nr:MULTISPECIES: glycosyltransferase family 2 protein [Litoribacter]MBS9523186.1 glycosyltransferase family 2 protein [Litoribacter alkaliphilus]MBT0810651.1 glycosyltransferase family 2 protein [Litoribacter ruber]
MILSIVLPTYNVENYLGSCLNSILNQGINPSLYEVLVINDGSTDNSGKIAERFSKIHNNVKVINQPNKGLSGARNTGLRNAIGKYVWFIDSDDIIVEGSLKLVFQNLNETNVDALVINFARCTPEGKLISSSPLNKTFDEYKTYTGVDYFSNRPGDFLCSWRYITKREILLTNDLFWLEGVIHEDNEHTPKLLYYIHSLKILHSTVYVYQVRPGSIMSSFSPKKTKSWIDIFRSLKVFRDSLPKNDSYRKCLNEYFLQQYSNYLHDRCLLPNIKAEIKMLNRVSFLEYWQGMGVRSFGKLLWIKNFPIMFSKCSYFYHKLT